MLEKINTGMNSIISSLRDGLVVINTEGKIMLVNDGFRLIVNAGKAETIEGKYLKNVNQEIPVISWNILRKT